MQVFESCCPCCVTLTIFIRSGGFAKESDIKDSSQHVTKS